MKKIIAILAIGFGLSGCAVHNHHTPHRGYYRPPAPVIVSPPPVYRPYVPPPRYSPYRSYYR